MSSKVSHVLRDRALDTADREVSATLATRCGLQVSGISDLVNTRERYREAYPVLLELLQRDYPIRIREFIVRALTVPDAHDIAFDYFVRLYAAPESATVRNLVGYESYRYALANAISVVARKEDRQTLIDFARDPRLGQSRSAFFQRIGRWKDNEVDSIIMDALSQPDVQYAAVEVAGKRRLAETVPRLTQLASSSDGEIGRVAKAALKRISQ